MLIDDDQETVDGSQRFSLLLCPVHISFPKNAWFEKIIDSKQTDTGG